MYGASPLCDYSAQITYIEEPLQLIYFIAVEEYKRGTSIVATLNSLLAANHQKDRENVITIMNLRANKCGKSVTVLRDQRVDYLIQIPRTVDFAAFVVSMSPDIDKFSLFKFERGDIQKVLDSPHLKTSCEIYMVT